MKKFILCLCLSMSMILCFSVNTGYHLDFSAAAGVNNWKQEEFVISTFHAVPGVPNGYIYEMLEKCKQAGLNYVETTFSSAATNHEVLRACEELGLKAIIQDIDHFGGFQFVKVPAKTDKEIEASVKYAAEAYGKYKSLAGFYIWDEPYQDQFPLVRKTMEAFARRFPDKLLFVVAQQSVSPSFQWKDGTFKSYIDDYAGIVDPPVMCSNYSYFTEMDLNGKHIDQSDVWDDLGYERRLALNKGIPFWYYVCIVTDPTDHSIEHMTVEKIRFQVNNLLAFGVKGISYYLTQTILYDDYGKELPFFSGVKEINEEAMVLGTYMLKFQSKLVYSSVPNLKANYIDRLSDSPFVESATNNLMFGEFKSENNLDYIFIMSRDFENRYKGSVKLKKNFRIDKLNKKTGKLELISLSADTIAIDYAPSEGNLYRISEPGSNPYNKTGTSGAAKPHDQKTDINSGNGSTKGLSGNHQSRITSDESSHSTTNAASENAAVTEPAFNNPEKIKVHPGIIAAVIILVAAASGGILWFLKFKKLPFTDD